MDFPAALSGQYKPAHQPSDRLTGSYSPVKAHPARLCPAAPPAFVSFGTSAAPSSVGQVHASPREISLIRIMPCLNPLRLSGVPSFVTPAASHAADAPC
jgi:hypothetical protein